MNDTSVAPAQTFKDWFLATGWRYCSVPPRIGEVLADLDPEHSKWWKTLWAADRIVRCGNTVMLTGPFGRGKSVMAAALLGLHWGRMRSSGSSEIPKMMTATHLLGKTKDSFGVTGGETALIRSFIRLPCLALDEVHERMKTDWSDSVITRVLKGRYDRNRPTIIISNDRTETLGQQIGESMLDRIVAADGLIRCGWDNLRRKSDGLVHSNSPTPGA